MNQNRSIADKEIKRKPNAVDVLNQLKVVIAEQLDRSAKDLEDEIKDHCLTKKHLANATSAIKVQEEKSVKLESKINEQYQTIKDLIDKVHHMEERNRRNEGKKWKIVNGMIITMTLVALFKITMK